MSAISNPLEDQIKRSTTPAASEKVLLFLEGIERAGGAISNPPSSIASHDDDYEPVASPIKDNFIHGGSNFHSERGIRSPAASKRSFQNGGSVIGDFHPENLENGDDAHSDEQVGRRSNVQSENMNAENDSPAHNEPAHHYASFDSSFGNLNLNLDGPGPADGPGPRYESGTSSFGNFGPLPPDNVLPGPSDVLPGWYQQQRTPMFAARVPLPTTAESATMSPRQFSQRTPMFAAGIPLPTESILMSPKSATKSAAKSSSYHIDIQPPTPPDIQYPGFSKAGSAISRRSDRTEKNNEPSQPVIPVIPAQTDDFSEFGHAIPNPTSSFTRAHSRPPTEKAATVTPMSPRRESEQAFSPRSNAEKNLFSPKSNASRALSGLSKPGTKAISHVGTTYPGLPASRAESMQYTASDDTPMSPPKSFQQPSVVQSYGIYNDTRHQQPTLHDTFSTTSHTNTDGPAVNYADTHAVPDSFNLNRPVSPFVNSPLGHAISAVTQELGGLATDISVMRQAVSGTLPVTASLVQAPPTEQSNRPSSPQMTRVSDPQSPQSPVRSRVVSPTRSLVHAPHSVSHSRRDIADVDDEQETPTPSRPHSPDMNEEQQILSDLLNRKARTRTSYATTALGADVEASHFHDQELCILLHAADDPMTHDVVRKVVKKAIRNRLKSLKMKHDPESIETYKRNFHDHDPSWHEHNHPSSEEPPAWAKDIMMHLTIMEQRVAALGPKIESLRSPEGSRGTRSQSHRAKSLLNHLSDSRENHTNGTPQSQPSHLRGQMTGDDSIFRPTDTEFTPLGDSTTHGQTLPGSMHHLEHPDVDEDEFEDENETQGPNGEAFTNRTPPTQDSTINYHFGREPVAANRNDSPGQQVLEEQLFRLRVGGPSQSQLAHQSWKVAREGVEDDETRQTESELPENAGSIHNGYNARRISSPPLPPLPTEANQSKDIIENLLPGQQAQHVPWAPTDTWTQETPAPPPWQRIHQRLLSWAIVWPMSELDSALNSTNRGFQIDEVALSIWSTQQYKRYVRNQLTEVPPGRIDRLFVPPNMADAINNAVLYGRHGDACGMLRDLWAPFGLEGMPRLIIVLCKHRTDANHWVAHKFSLPDGTLTTYDTYPEKSLPDGRPLGWWFAIRIAWPTAMYPSPDHLMQKMVRLHRPMQLAIDNSVAAAGIWRNLLMSSRAERPLDLERLRDLINTEVKNLRQRKEQGKLSISATRPKWEMAI